MNYTSIRFGLIIATTFVGATALAQPGGTTLRESLSTQSSTGLPPSTTVEFTVPEQKLHSVDLPSRLPAELAETTLKKLFPDTVFSADTVSNTLYFRSDDKQRAEIEAFVERASRKAQAVEYEKELLLREQQDLRRAEEMQAELKLRERNAMIEDKRDVRILQTKHVAAMELHRVVQELGLLDSVNVSSTGDALVLSGSEPSELDRVIALAKELDVPSKDTGRLDTFLSRSRGATAGNQWPIQTRHQANFGQSPSHLPLGRGTVEDQEKAFRAKQSYLREQIELQKRKLKLLEQRLEQRELAAQAYFKAAKAKGNLSARNPDSKQLGSIAETEIEVVDEIGTIVLRGKEEDVAKVTELIEEISEKANETPAVINETPAVINETPDTLIEEVAPPGAR